MILVHGTTYCLIRGLEEYMFVPSSEKLIGVKGEYGVYHVNQKEKRSVIDPFDRRAIDY
jgi:hypothetical protein